MKKITDKSLSYYLYYHSKTQWHKQQCDICRIFVQDKALTIINKPDMFFKIGEKVCMECYFK